MFSEMLIKSARRPLLAVGSGIGNSSYYIYIYIVSLSAKSVLEQISSRG